MSLQEKPQPTQVQYFFWLFSGSEIHVLKECPTDFNRHAIIGFAIFITSLVAFVLATVAGLKFSDGNIAAGLAAGLLWGLLVFSIDRTMVMSLKKDPNNPNQKLIRPLIIRAILAAVICFVIAIPLELLIFDEEIKVQMQVDKAEEIKEQQSLLADNFRLDEWSNAVSNSQNQLDSLNRLQNADEPESIEYKLKKEEYLTAKKQTEILQTEHDNKTRESRTLWNEIPENIWNERTKTYEKNYQGSSAGRKYLALRDEIRGKADGGKIGTLTQRLIDFKELTAKLAEELNDVKVAYLNDLHRRIALADSTDRRLDSLDAQNQDSFANTIGGFGEVLGRSNGFVRQFIGLNNINDPWTHFLIWFIRLVLFIIELTPSITKVYGKPTAYDHALQEAEDSLKAIYSKRIEENKKLAKELEEERANKEKEFHIKLLGDILAVQTELAKAAMEKWKETQLAALDNDPSQFVQGNSGPPNSAAPLVPIGPNTP